MFGNVTDLGSLFEDFRKLEQALHRPIGTRPMASSIRATRRGVFPAINVSATPSAVKVQVFAGGCDPSKFDVSLQHNVLTIAGRRRNSIIENAKRFRHERFDGEFRRAVTLPEDIAADRVDATYRDGILRIEVGRREESVHRKIEVQG